MDGDGKKPLKAAIIEFYKVNSKKGKEYTVKHFNLQSIDGLKSLKPLEIAIENMDPEPFERTSSCCK